MPVFSAFGWAGEANALKFALAQLEAFIGRLHNQLSQEARMELPFFGLDQEAQAIFLAVKRETEEGPYIAFLARPTTFEMRFSVTDKAVLNRGLRAAERNPADWHRYLKQLGDNWYLHIQQNHVDEDSGEDAFYQDIYKGAVDGLTAEECAEITTRAAFLNSEPKWITPLYISFRLPSEQAAGMNLQLTKYMSERVDQLMSILFLFTHSTTKGKAKGRKADLKKSLQTPAEPTNPDISARPVYEESFSFVAELKPLHLRRGFINLTSGHWPFFADSARSETREVTVFFDGQKDNNCSVWRLQPSDMARIVLSENAQHWLELNFEPDSAIKVEATRLAGDEIHIQLAQPD